MQKVYLAGGMRVEWRERIKKECKGLIFFCPVDKETSQDMTVDEYGIWDLHYIKQADIVFGYMERTNPSGIGLACEMGMAYGMGKTVILVLEKDSQHFADEKLAFMRKVAHITFSELQGGINYLKIFRLKKENATRKKNTSARAATSKRSR